MDIRGSKTEKNLLAAFAGESQARNRYTYFASAAKNEGFDQISGIFLETAGITGKTVDNLLAAAEGEKLEWSTLYPEFARIAKEGSVFKKKNTVKWHCRNCGYIHEGTEAPKVCPACRHSQSYYEVLAQNW